MTQKELDKMLVQVLTQAEEAGIPVSRRICPHVRINRRATSRFGCCIKNGNDYTIELSERLLFAEVHACLQTLAHEILHTCPGGQDHGVLWRKYAAQMNQDFGYKISRTGTCAALGVEDTAPVRHLVFCECCGREFRRAKASSLVKHPERYRCKCGGHLILRY